MFPNTARALSGGETYRLYSLRGYVGEASGRVPKPPDEGCSNPGVSIFPLPSGNDPVVAIAGSWNAVPRLARPQSSDQRLYQETVWGTLEAQGFPRLEARITQLFRVDLEGDGIEEVLLSAGNVDPRNPNAPVSAYSTVLIRQVVGGHVETMTVKGHFYLRGCEFCGPELASVAAVIVAGTKSTTSTSSEGNISAERSSTDEVDRRGLGDTVVAPPIFFHYLFAVVPLGEIRVMDPAR